MGETVAHRAKRPHAKGGGGYYVTCPSLLPMRGRGKSLSVCVRLGRAKRPHAKGVLYDMFSPIAHGRRGKSLKVWVRLLPMGPIDHMLKEVHIMLVVCRS